MAVSGANPSPEQNQQADTSSPHKTSVLDGRHRILIVEDNPSDVFLIREAIQAAVPDADLYAVHDGENAIRFFDQAGENNAAPCPNLVVLDINLPRKHGGEVLRYIRKSSRCPNTLVLVSTSSDSPLDRAEMGELGANAYFHKPSDYEEFFKIGGIVKQMLENTVDDRFDQEGI